MTIRIRKTKAGHFIAGSLLAVDTETTGLRAWQGDCPFSIAFCNEAGGTIYFEWPVDPKTRRVQPDSVELAKVKRLMEDPAVEKVFHNAKFDVRMLENSFGIRTLGRVHDTMFAAHVCNTLEGSYGLKRLANKYLDYPETDLSELKKIVQRCRRIGKKLGWALAEDLEADYWMPMAFQRLGHAGYLRQIGLDEAQAEACKRYCIGDVERTMLLFAFFREAMVGIQQEYDAESADLQRHLTEYPEEAPAFAIKTDQTRMDIAKTYAREIELWPINYQMETRGVRVDPVVVATETKRCHEEIAKWKPVVMNRAWKGFDIDSPQQCGKLFYGKLHLPILKRTARGQPQVNFDALMQHVENPVVAALFKYRAAEKALKSFFLKYTENLLPDPLNPGGFALHPDFNQVGPCTGRFSCRNPNLQNVANALTTRSSEPIQARTPFGPRPGFIWYHIDYQQLEVRIFADVCEEGFMIEALTSGRDLHTECTNKAWGGPGNPAAIRAAVHALELDATGDHRNPAVQAAWKEWGLKDPRILKDPERERLAEEWLADFDFDIVKAEKSLEKKTSRAKAKMLLFLKIFGGGAGAAADLIRCSYEEAKQFLKDYDVAFPRISEYLETLSGQAKADGYIVNRYGRRISVTSDAPYRCVNYMVQGSAADLMKRSMVRAHGYLRESGLDAHMVLTIHDELVFEVRKEHAYKSMLRGLVELMADHEGHFRVETPAEIDKVTVRWDKKEKVNLVLKEAA